MYRYLFSASGLVAMLAAFAVADAPRAPQSNATRSPAAMGVIAAPPADAVRARTLAWVAQTVGNDRQRLEEIGKLWTSQNQPLSAEQLLALTIQSFALADPAVQAFVEACRLQRPPLLPPEARVLERAEFGPFYKANLGLFYGRYLAQRQMYEEALGVLDRIDVADVVDPAGLLFYKAVCQHRLLMKTEGLATIAALLKNTEAVPVRYSTVATLMQFDLEALEDESLDEISRKMSDVERRLNLGRTGHKVQKKEEEIIASLDAIIKKIEDQQGGGGAGGGGGNGNRATGPAGDSTIKGSTAPGQVDPKSFKPGAEWGDLPPRERGRAKQLISREFPAHYRTAIEEFTRKAANRPAAGK